MANEALGEDLWFDLLADTGPDLVVLPHGDYKLVRGHEALRQSLIRRFCSNPGSWKAVPGYGAGLPAMLRSKATQSNVAAMKTRLRSQALRDDRVASVQEVTITRLMDAGGIPSTGRRIHVTVIPKAEPIPLDVDFTLEGA